MAKTAFYTVRQPGLSRLSLQDGTHWRAFCYYDIRAYTLTPELLVLHHNDFLRSGFNKDLVERDISKFVDDNGSFGAKTHIASAPTISPATNPLIMCPSQENPASMLAGEWPQVEQRCRQSDRPGRRPLRFRSSPKPDVKPAGATSDETRERVA